ncbi:hypothetical protein [Rhodopila sp.]|uniref:hypothetical protein n=1 Tax=Rhodopila sp. TaxID=2480087 RepID=UPI003D13BF2C
MFKRPVLAAALLIGLVGAASADVSITSESGAWKTIAGTATDGKTVCGAEIIGQDRILLIKWFAGVDGLIIQIAKTGWNIPDGQQVDVLFQFDQLAPWRARAVGVQGTSATGSRVEFRIQGDDITGFIDQLRLASHMSVAFPSGSERPWSASLKGSNIAIVHMMQCVRSVVAARSSQPSGVAPSQPGPNVSQPFTPASPVGRPAAPFSGPPAPPYSPRSVEGDI